MNTKYKVGQYVELIEDKQTFEIVDVLDNKYRIANKNWIRVFWVSEDEITRSSKWAEGEIIVDINGYKYKILGEAGEILFISWEGDFKTSSSAVYTQKELESAGYTRLEDEEVVEMTVEQISKELGKTVKVVK